MKDRSQDKVHLANMIVIMDDLLCDLRRYSEEDLENDNNIYCHYVNQLEKIGSEVRELTDECRQTYPLTNWRDWESGLNAAGNTPKTVWYILNNDLLRLWNQVLQYFKVEKDLN